MGSVVVLLNLDYVVLTCAVLGVLWLMCVRVCRFCHRFDTIEEISIKRFISIFFISFVMKKPRYKSNMFVRIKGNSKKYQIIRNAFLDGVNKDYQYDLANELYVGKVGEDKLIPYKTFIEIWEEKRKDNERNNVSS